MKKFSNYKLLFITLFWVLYSYSHSQVKPKDEEVKSLVIVEGEEKYWTKKQREDSINWMNVKSVKVLKDSIDRVEKYGERGKYGVMIIQYKN